MNLKLSAEGQKAISRAVTKTVKFKREIEHSENKIVNYFKTRLDLEYTSPALKRHEIRLIVRKTSERKFRIVVQKNVHTYRHY